MIQNQIDLLKATRTLIAKSIAKLSLEEVNKIPDNFNNSIAWNVAHIVVTQQLLHYGLSEIPFKINKSLINNYRKDTKPNTPVNAANWEEIINLLLELPAILERDYNAGIFKKFKVYPTSYGYTLNNIEQAISFNNAHEALHLGYIMAIKKII